MCPSISNKEPLAKVKYRPDIDGLRALAVLSVVGFHAFPALIKGGFIGVDIFFVISGFLISTIIFKNLENGNFWLVNFYNHRIRRIFPALILVLIVLYMVGWFGLTDNEYKQLGKHIAASVCFIQNLVLWNESGYFDADATAKPLLHLWSLSLEEQFYLFWPIFLRIFWRKNRALILISLLCIISFTLNIVFIRKDPIAVFYFPGTRIWTPSTCQGYKTILASG